MSESWGLPSWGLAAHSEIRGALWGLVGHAESYPPILAASNKVFRDSCALVENRSNVYQKGKKKGNGQGQERRMLSWDCREVLRT